MEKNVLERETTLRFLNYFTLIGFIIGAFIVIFFDYKLFLSLHPDEAIRYWYLDDDLLLPLSLKGIMMIICTIICFLAFVIFLWDTFQLNKIRIRKNNTNISRLLFFSSFYLMIGQILEAFYIISMSDFEGLVFGTGQFYYPLDLVGIGLFVIFVAQVFLIEDLMKNQRIANFIFIIIFIPVAFGIISIMLYHLNLTTVNLVTSISMIALFLLFGLINLNIATKIINVQKRVSERQTELKWMVIPLLLILGIIIFIALTFLFLMDISQHPISYLFRSLKALSFIIIGLIYRKAFILPAKT